MKLDSYILKGMLEEELDRQQRLENKILSDIANLPKGSLQLKKIKDGHYYYLAYREGDKVKSVYVRPEKLDELKREVEDRRQLEILLKSIKKNIRSLKKVTGQ